MASAVEHHELVGNLQFVTYWSKILLPLAISLWTVYKFAAALRMKQSTGAEYSTFSVP